MLRRTAQLFYSSMGAIEEGMQTQPAAAWRQVAWTESNVRIAAGEQLLAYGVTVRVADLVTELAVAEIRTVVEEVRVRVVMVKVAVVAPAGTTTLAGTRAMLVLALVSDMVNPAAGAIPVSVTVPVEFVPPFTEVGLKVSELRAGTFTVSVRVRVTVPNVAEITGVARAATA